jgi:hypothetical protein
VGIETTDRASGRMHRDLSRYESMSRNVLCPEHQYLVSAEASEGAAALITAPPIFGRIGWSSRLR